MDRQFTPAIAEQLIGVSQQNLRDMRRDGILSLGADGGNRVLYSLADLLAIEAALHLSRQGLPWKRAFSLLEGSAALPKYFEDRQSHSLDLWAAEFGALAEDGSPGESLGLEFGSVEDIASAVKRHRRGGRYFPDDPSWIFMTNLSAADRRIRARARAAGIAIL